MRNDTPQFIDMGDVSDDRIRAAAKTVCAIVHRSAMKETNDPRGRWQATFGTLKEDERIKLCPDEPFANDPVISDFICSGFLVSACTVATAGHSPLYPDRSYLCVFDFKRNGTDPPPSFYSDDQVFTVTDIRQADPRSAHDWALLTLAGAVTRKPMTLDETITYNDLVHLLGHPLGLSMKCATGRVTSVRDCLFNSTAVAYEGMSGGPVVKDGCAAGITIGGEGRLSDRDAPCRRWVGCELHTNPFATPASGCSQAWRIGCLPTNFGG